MARQRKPADDVTAAVDMLVRLRLHDRTATDWAFSCEGWLLLYDPEVVTDAVFAEMQGFQTIAAAALGWMAGHAAGSDPFAPIGELGVQPRMPRAEVARRVARIVELGWDRALATLPFCVNLNGMDIRFTATGLTSEEKRVQMTKGRQKKGLTTLVYPRVAFISPRGPRLGVTWDWMLGFTPRQKRRMFDPGYQMEFAWPAGDYQARAWQFDTLENEDTAEYIEQLVIQMVPVAETERTW